MSAWVKPGSSGGSSSGGFHDYATGSGTPGPSVYKPTLPSSGGSDGGSASPGVFEVNPLNPEKTAGDIGENLGALFSGLRQTLFGSDTPDANNQRGGLVGDIPIVGDLGRGITAVPGVVGDVVGQGLEDAKVLERLPTLTPQMPGISGMVDDEYEAIPDEFKAEYEERMKGETGLLGTGLFSLTPSIKAEAIRAWREEQQFENPSTNARFTPSGSIMDDLKNVMDVLGILEQGAERLGAGAGGMDQVAATDEQLAASGVDFTDGMNRIDKLRIIAAGGKWVGLPDEQQGLNALEALALEKVNDGDWTEEEAMDFLVTRGSGWSHDPGKQILGTVAGDPLNIATFGAGAVAKAGMTGAKLLSRSERAAALLATADEDLKAAQLALQGAKGTKAVKAATAQVDELTAAREAAAKSVEDFKVFTPSKAPRDINVLGRAAAGSEKAADLLKVVGKVYTGLEGTSIGRASKITRTIIDPLHAMDLRLPGAARMVDIYSDALPKTVVQTLGDNHHMAILEDLTKLDGTGSLRDQFSKDLAVATANRGREGAAVLHRAGQLDDPRLTNGLMKTIPGDVVEEAIAAVREKDMLRWLRYDVTKNILIRNWDDTAKRSLADQLEALYHVRTSDEWMAQMAKMSDEQLSFYKLAAYGNSNRRLLDGVSNAKAAGHAAATDLPLDRMVLLAKSTLTRVHADDLLSKLKRPGAKLDDKVKLIRDMQERFPKLGYIAIDDANKAKSVDEFIEWLGDGLDRLPMVVKREELGALPGELQDLQATLGDGYRLGFRPADEFLWGIERTNAKGGGFAVVGEPWVDHVADGGLGYRPGRALRSNVAGMPVVGLPVKAALKSIDYLEVGARMLKAQVSGAQIAEMARQRFVSQAVRGHLAEAGLTEGVAQKWWERIQKYTREHQGYSGPRGFAKGDLYADLRRENLIPHTLLNGSTRLTENDVMLMVLRAYDGDIRAVGLTQKLSGRAKRFLFETTGSNFAGQVADHLWPTMKFRYNPIFQLQEKLEPWILNAARGVDVKLGRTANKADEATEALLQRLTDNSIVRQADLDQAEYSAQLMHGKGVEALSGQPGTRLAQMRQMATAILEVQGVKRLNMLSTFRKGLGKELRGAWEQTHPGTWDDMKELADVRAGRILNDDEFALQFMGEQLFASDVMVSRLNLAGKGLPDFDNAIKTGAWHTPTALGELKSLDLDHVAKSLRIPDANGDDILDLADLRKYLGENNARLAEVSDGLRRLGADKDYITRVENALTFSWTGFWKTAGERFSLSADESRALQDMVAGAAELRDMSPVDFMSQVFAPGIIDGTEGILGSLQKAKDLRSQLAGKAGVSTREDLVRQMAATFADYLDPSAKRALLMEFRPDLRKLVQDGKVKLEPEDLKAMWDDTDDGQLADRITGYMSGQPGAGAHDVVDDVAMGVKSARDSAAEYMAKRGVTPLTDRRYYAVDQALYDETAKAYSALPEVPFEQTGRVPKVNQIIKADTDLKPNPGVDERTYAAYQDFVLDTRAQWDHMTASKKNGGMGLRVTVSRTDPYTPDAAGRAAMQADVSKGRLKVKGSDADHPLMTNEQTVMFRAVHDVYGHAAEGFQFGPRGELNAAAKHSQMYSDTGRAAMLTETHGQTSYVNFSDDIIPDAFTPAKTYAEARAEYTRLHPEASGVSFEPKRADSAAIQWDFESSIGDGIDRLAAEGFEAEMTEVLNTVNQLRATFPDAPMAHFDVSDVVTANWGRSTEGIVIGAKGGKTTMLLNADMWRDPDFFARQAAGEAEFQTFAQGDLIPSKGFFRETEQGVPYIRGQGPMSTIYHEHGHVLDSWLRYGPGSDARALTHQAYFDFADDFTDMEATTGRFVKARQQLSEYTRTSDEEGMAELLGTALDPRTDMAALGPELQSVVTEFRGILDGLNIRKPVSPNAGKTVREANALGSRGTVYAPQKAGLLDQGILDRFGAQFVGKGKHVEANPDVARAAQYFGKWTSRVVENGLLKGAASEHAGLLNDIAGIPTKDAAAYNLTEALYQQLATTSMQNKMRDAFRLQYFAQERSMLERSINHPMFGLYPASYMWGKMGPEVIRFIAQSPFGIRTGGMGYGLVDAQGAIAMQREYDLKFDDKIEELGHSQALSFLNYMLPAVPWEVSASAPNWMRDIAGQGNTAAAAAAAGQEMPDFNALKPATDVVSKFNPLSTTLPWFSRAAGEVIGEKAAESDVAEPVLAADLATPLGRVMQELREALAE
jgi:hypothetical protein